MSTLGSLSVKLGLDPKRFRSGLTAAGESLRAFKSRVNENTKELATLRTAFGGFGEYARKSVMSVTNLPLATEAVASVKSLAGAIGLIPAVAGAAGLAVGTLKIAFSGFGQAMKDIRDPKKFAEAIKEMPPPMQETAQAVRDLLPQWDGLKKSVQSTMFAGLSNQVKQLGNTYMPILSTATTATAGSFNKAAHSIGEFLKQPNTVNDISVSMGNMSKFTDGFARALKPAVQIFVDFVTVGSEFLPAMGDGMANAAEKAAAFVRNARETGKLKAWIQEGIDTLKAFVATIVNVGQILNGVLQAANVNGQGFAQTLERITARLEAWVKSAEGQEKIRQVFEGLRNVAFALLAILGPLSTVIFAIAGAFAALPAPVQVVIGQFIGWGGLVVLLGSKLLMLGAAVKGLFGLVKSFGSGLAWLGPKLLLLGRTLLYAGINATYAAAKFALAAATTVAKLAWMALTGIMHVTRLVVTTLAQFAVMAATATAHAVRMAVTVGAQFALMAATAIAHMVRTAAVVVAQWAVMAAGAMAHAIRMAAAWFVAMGPIGWVIGAVVGLVALIIANWDTVKRWTAQAWSAVSGFVSDAWEKIKSWVQSGVDRVRGILAWFGGLGGMFRGWWDAGVRAVSDAIGAMLRWVSLLVDIGRDMVNGLWRGIQAGWSWLTQQVANLARSLFDAAKRALGIASPSKKFRWIGIMLGRGFAAGINRSRSRVQGAMGDLVKVTSMVPTSLARMGNLTQQIGSMSITRPGMVATPHTQVPVPGLSHSGISGDGRNSVPVVRLDDSALSRLVMELIRKQTRVQGGTVQLVLGR